MHSKQLRDDAMMDGFLDGSRSVGDDLALFRIGDSVLVVGFQLDFLLGWTSLESLLVGQSCHYSTDDRPCPVHLFKERIESNNLK